MYVIYEKFINENGVEDERNIGDFDTLKEAKLFLESKREINLSIANLSKMLKTKGVIKKKYQLFKINF